MPTVTIGDIADRIALPREDKKAVRKRLTNWAKEGLLDYLGPKQPGSGSHREFEHETIVDAAVLSALRELGIPAIRAILLGGEERTMFFHCRLAARRWRSWSDTTFYLILKKAIGDVRPPVGQRSVEIQDRNPVPSEVIGGPVPSYLAHAVISELDIRLPNWVDAAVVVNLTKLFSRIDYSPEN
jgi:hypothetical protein